MANKSTVRFFAQLRDPNGRQKRPHIYPHIDGYVVCQSPNFLGLGPTPREAWRAWRFWVLRARGVKFTLSWEITVALSYSEQSGGDHGK